jgi:Flp pilus assembly protein TadD
VAGYSDLGTAQQLKILQQDLFRPEVFEFSYDDSVTLTAREAFEQRRGNCMSFTALFIGLSRSVGVPTFLVAVRRAPEVERADGLVVVNRHVVAGYRSPDEVMLFDFYVTSSVPYVRHTVVDDVMASTMYHANIGGAAIRTGELEDALRHLTIATRLEPEWPAGWVNLGVARSRAGDVDGAMDAYRTALEVDPGNSSALTNMSFVYRDLGMDVEARAALAAAARRSDNPFTLIAMADLEMVRGDLDRASRYLRKARWWYSDEPAVFDALARLARREGRDKRAERHSRRAAELRREQSAESGDAGAPQVIR